MLKRGAQEELELLPDKIDYVVHLAAAISGVPPVLPPMPPLLPLLLVLRAPILLCCLQCISLPHLLPTPYEMTDINGVVPLYN